MAKSKAFRSFKSIIYGYFKNKFAIGIRRHSYKKQIMPSVQLPVLFRFVDNTLFSVNQSEQK